MNNEIKDIAARIKMLRETFDETEENMAALLGISKETYIQYESGETDISVGDLCRIAAKFKVDLTSLITGEQPKLKSYCVVRAGKYPQIERRKEYKYFDLSYNFVNKKAETFMVTVDPKNETGTPKQYSHDGQEFNFILEGSMKLYIGDNEIILREGDAIYFDSTQKHAMRPETDQPVKFLAVIIK